MLPLFSKADLVQPRTPDALYCWVMSVAQAFGETPEHRAYARSGALLPKKFYDEILPLAVFARKEYGGREDVLVTPNLGNDNYDATVDVIGSGASQRLYVETTLAKDGYDEALRLEALAINGFSSLTGPVYVEGRRGAPNRKVTVEPEAEEHAELRGRALQIVSQRLQAKSRARYGKDHLLVVAVDDHLPFRQAADADALHLLAQLQISSLPLDFGRVVFVGMAERLWLSYSVGG